MNSEGARPPARLPNNCCAPRCGKGAARAGGAREEERGRLLLLLPPRPCRPSPAPRTGKQLRQPWREGSPPPPRRDLASPVGGKAAVRRARNRLLPLHSPWCRPRRGSRGGLGALLRAGSGGVARGAVQGIPAALSPAARPALELRALLGWADGRAGVRATRLLSLRRRLPFCGLSKAPASPCSPPSLHGEESAVTSEGRRSEGGGRGGTLRPRPPANRPSWPGALRRCRQAERGNSPAGQGCG